MTYPEQTHKNCPDSNCKVCLKDHLGLGNFFDEQIGTKFIDHLGKYRTWLEQRHWNCETEHGWATPAVFDPVLIQAYIDSWLE